MCICTNYAIVRTFVHANQQPMTPNSGKNVIVKHRHEMVTDCHRLPMVPIVLTSAPMVSVADVSVKLYPLTVRLSSRVVSKMSAHLLHLSQFIPREFSRRSRSLSEIDRWKATEFRLFLLYLSPVVLASALTENHYKHFLLLFTGCTLLSKSSLCNKINIAYAENLLRLFVQGVAELYGKEELVYNIHGLLHIAADADTLENFSSFPFENKLK